MSNKSVYCMADSDAEAAVIYQRLREEGFTPRRITVLVRDPAGGSHDYTPDSRVDRPVPAESFRHAGH